MIDGIRVARKRVLRLMREHALLSPHRARAAPKPPHDRRIVTEAPNVMWATDATQVVTVQDGKVWLFGVAEHWNAELLGWHVAKRGTRFEALQASAWRCASSSAPSARGLHAGSRYATTTAATSCPATSSVRLAPGAWRRATHSLESPKRRMKLTSRFWLPLLFSPCARVTAWRRAGTEVQSPPRSLQSLLLCGARARLLRALGLPALGEATVCELGIFSATRLLAADFGTVVGMRGATLATTRLLSGA